MPQKEVMARLRVWLTEHAGGDVTCIETHISWVLLTADRAYKVHRAVNLGFVDFTSLAFRLQDTLAEYQLNRRSAPDLYLGVWALRSEGLGITLAKVDPQAPPVPGKNDIEYVLEMRRFDPGQRFDELLSHGQLTPALIDALADALVGFHQRCEVVRDPELTNVADLQQGIADNVKAVLDMSTESTERAVLQQHQKWLTVQSSRWHTRMAQRVEAGLLRDAHGDLHLQNICRFQGQVTLFDCLEFSPRLRCIDLMNDLGFLIMDLQAREAPRLAWRLLNRYLEQTGDYAGVALLRYFMAYRAMVRIKVALLSPNHAHTAYLRLVRCLMQTPMRALIITHGLSGSGKTTVTHGLVETLGAIRLRSDVERQRLFGRQSAGRSQRYTPETTEQIYTHLANQAKDLLVSGHIVVVDATFLSRSQRDRFRAVARCCEVPFVILHCQADNAILHDRVEARVQAGHDASEADTAVLDAQLRHDEPLGADEMADAITLQTAQPRETWYQPATWQPLLAHLGLSERALPLMC